MKLGKNIGSVTIPKRPSTVGGLVGWARGVNRALQELRDRKVSFSSSANRPSGSKDSWKLTTAIDEGDVKWNVSASRSTITDGTNGDAIDLTLAGFDTPETIDETKFIVLEADVDIEADVDEEDDEEAVSNWKFSAVDAEDIEEVGMTDVVDEIPKQNKLRLLIGKITFTDDVASVEQIETRPQILDYGFLNGILVKILNPFQVHHSEFDEDSELDEE